MKPKLTKKQQQSKKAAAVGRKRIALHKEQVAEQKISTPAPEPEVTTLPEEIKAEGELTVFKDPHRRPGILISRGHTYAHLIGRQENGHITMIKTDLREFNTEWDPLELNKQPYPVKRAAQFWLDLNLDDEWMPRSVRATLTQIVAGEVPSSTISTTKEHTMSTKKASKKSVAAKSNGKATVATNGDGEKKITLIVKDNPKRKGSDSYKRYELYKKSATVGAFLKAGGSRSDLNWDSKHQFIKVGA